MGTAGGLGGTTENDVIRGVIRVSTLLRGLTVELSAAYTNIRSSLVRSSDRRIELHSWTVGVRAIYKATTWMSLYAGYVFYEQQSNTGAALAADQNRVTFGVLLGYSFTFD